MTSEAEKELAKTGVKGHGYLTKAGVRSGHKRPQWRGSITIGNRNYWVSGWDSEDVAGKPVVSLRLEQK